MLGEAVTVEDMKANEIPGQADRRMNSPGLV
jgi:hypothetical protein